MCHLSFCCYSQPSRPPLTLFFLLPSEILFFLSLPSLLFLFIYLFLFFAIILPTGRAEMERWHALFSASKRIFYI